MHVIDDNVFAIQVGTHELSPAVGEAASMTRDGIYADSPALDAPMLWYVEQAVPDPRCTLASTICPSVNALVPQVYLPEGYAQALAVPTGGTISGENIKLTVHDLP
ncbi:MAG: hypothetical protein CL858_06810, partial [Cupriavidus sp.]|nr:hypothetical protein [Cupriavidus sp.]